MAESITQAGSHLPEATVTRLPLYLRALAGHADAATISSQALADAAGVNPAQVRKDLSYLGSNGVRGVGYDVGRLRELLGEQTGSELIWRLAIVGMGNLGQALANYAGRRAQGFRVVAAFDVDPRIIGQRIMLGTDELAVHSLPDLGPVLDATGAAIAIIATPPEAAQDIADRLTDVGITSILNFSAAPLHVPPHVHVRHVDLAMELHVLAYHQQRSRALEDLPLLKEVSVQ